MKPAAPAALDVKLRTAAPAGVTVPVFEVPPLNEPKFPEANSVTTCPAVILVRLTVTVIGTPTWGDVVDGCTDDTSASAGLDVQPAIAKPMASNPAKGNRNFLELIA